MYQPCYNSKSALVDLIKGRKKKFHGRQKFLVAMQTRIGVNILYSFRRVLLEDDLQSLTMVKLEDLMMAKHPKIR